MPNQRRYPVGTEFIPEQGAFHCRVWAPQCKSVTIQLKSTNNILKTENLPLHPEENGYFSGFIYTDTKELLYGFILDNSDQPLPDPASRFQPSGLTGMSAFVNPYMFDWTDSEWRGPGDVQKILYEMHIGTFTPEGTWQSAEKQLPELAAIGITVLEIMPVAEFSGSFNWGYDGVLQFAPSHTYGSPDDLRHFIDSAHRCKIAVLLDVVYNHLGKGAHFFKNFSPGYFSKRYDNEWGEAINFDDDSSGPVRQYFLSNAAYWISEFHFDGLRVDATQQIFDSSDKNILSEIVASAKNAAACRTVFIVAENEPQDTSILREHKFDAVWSDDFHRSATVVLTSHNEAYYSDYNGTPQEFVSAAKYGYLYQGQYYVWQKKNRGSPTRDLPPCGFIHYLQNHDQIANSCRGLRLHYLCSFSLYKTFTALLILGPQTPLLFMGQEFCSSAPFYFFSDTIPQYSERTLRGRQTFLSQFQSITSVNGPLVPHPHQHDSFLNCKLNFNERITNKQRYRFHRDLLTIRKTDPIFRELQQTGIDGAVIGAEAFVLRYFSNTPQNDRLLIINFGKDLSLSPNPEPLLAPPLNCSWKLLWHSEAADYEGDGIQPLNFESVWDIRGQTAFFLGGIQD